MAKPIALYEGGITGLIEKAVRQDGTIFARYQNKTIYGYRWSAWKPEGKFTEEQIENLPFQLEAGFSTLFKSEKTNRRLPN